MADQKDDVTRIPAKPEADERLGVLRGEIDELDLRIVELLNRRASCSLEVGRIKRGAGDCIFKPVRERQVMERLLVHADSLPERHLRAIYREIFSSSRHLQRPQQVAYLGPEGTFSYFAGIEFLGHSADYIPQNDLEGVFRAVSTGEAELGIVPLENSLHGTVGQSLDLFLRFGVSIQSELFCKISHNVLGMGTSLADVRRVYSHPQPLAQCARWLRANMPNAVLVPVESTAAAAARVQNEPDAAAIGHVRLGDIFGLNVLARGVEDLPDNWTRFVVIGIGGESGGGRDKTSLLFTLPDKPGALSGVLDVFARHGVNMKKLESRPMRSEKWKYVFFVDVECDLERGEYASALAEMRERCHTVRILGCYPAGPSLDVSADLGADGPE
ncbi:chorismate mutase/prephenate dehydratase [Desulfobaculum xiamenense]|uniref:Bifunctional chorismate mutase/prephenate dehydratase n=1 Tax=Desulfobaculum xiamenense TaxID=995050 RepID=A0A846QUD9_9BACT|nr:prephenate dehydratase [Desulfobaculum xiamenense]NJB68259.1 chorismate mutase/prephenate dehydratase [Desulfobaculum xiamenense]